jgi:hypothetical protein
VTSNRPRRPPLIVSHSRRPNPAAITETTPTGTKPVAAEPTTPGRDISVITSGVASTRMPVRDISVINSPGQQPPAPPPAVRQP